MSSIVEYFKALERLKKREPLIVQKDTKISKDSVSLEAGRQKGSIKKSRAIFKELIAAIDEAAIEQKLPEISQREKLTIAKAKIGNYRQLYEEALAREIMLIRRIYELEKHLSESTKNKVTSISKK
ncbi:hypothetical protein [Rheinheimera baltica]|uniref:hypothetical protein n=1 Tax=Rheinheimera baltica TaxID=67576 RepID=UPI00048402A5|nr:hypothetical protein [Rheinheimera baltica]